jgi:hypothetical protein
MSRRPARFTQADFFRAVRAVQRAGGGMAVEALPDGTIRAVPAADLPASQPKDPAFDPARRIRL